jgi:hypothetical protein
MAVCVIMASDRQTKRASIPLTVVATLALHSVSVDTAMVEAASLRHARPYSGRPRRPRIAVGEGAARGAGLILAPRVRGSAIGKGRAIGVGEADLVRGRVATPGSLYRPRLAFVGTVGQSRVSGTWT